MGCTIGITIRQPDQVGIEIAIRESNVAMEVSPCRERLQGLLTELVLQYGDPDLPGLSSAMWASRAI